MAYTKKTFEPHMMYKNNLSVMAKTHKEHLRLLKLGYTHTKNKMKKK
jgi:hypothetical protein